MWGVTGRRMRSIRISIWGNTRWVRTPMLGGRRRDILRTGVALNSQATSFPVPYGSFSGSSRLVTSFFALIHKKMIMLFNIFLIMAGGC